jgi:hypothetical protein
MVEQLQPDIETAPNVLENEVISDNDYCRSIFPEEYCNVNEAQRLEVNEFLRQQINMRVASVLRMKKNIYN